jgi:uncharacterized protein
MILDISALLSGKVDVLEFDYIIPLLDEEGEATILPPPNVDFTSGIHVCGKITDNAGYMALKASCEIGYRTECARCLTQLEGVFTYAFEKIAAKAGTIEGDEDNYVMICDGRIDFDRDVAEEVSLEFPTRFLCTDECLGLCPKCGKNRNLEPCDCANQKEIDPRLAILQKLLENQ